MGKDVDVLEAREIEGGAGRQVGERGLRDAPPAVAIEHGIEPSLDRVQMQHVTRRISLLLVRQLGGRPVRTLLLLRQLDAEELPTRGP